MRPGNGPLISRRAVLAGTGALIVSCSLPRVSAGAAVKGSDAPLPRPTLPGSLEKTPWIDAWIRIDADNTVTAFTGKAELGQGIRTALLQVVAEELDVAWDRLSLVTADTGRTPNEGFTAGSHSVQDSGTALRHAAAQARDILVAEAARRFHLPVDQLRAEAGSVRGPDGLQLTYGQLISSELLHAEAQPTSRLRDPSTLKVMGHPVPRVDIPGKVTGGPAYVHDMRLEGMVHARIVRPPSYHALLRAVDVNEVESMPGVMKVIRDGNFLAVVAQREFQAVKAMRVLTRAARWQERRDSLPNRLTVPQMLQRMAARDEVILERRLAPAAGKLTLHASYSRPYLSHGSIGPACAVAQWDADLMTIWTHTQGVFPDREAIAEMLSLRPEQVHCIHVQGAGCYGHNGADDAAADAALLAYALPGRPVRVQWMREQEHAWEPFGPAMLARVRASLDDSGSIVDWQYEVWSNTHSMRPGPAGALLAAQHMARAFPIPEPRPIPLPEGGGDRNALPLYNLPNTHVTHHFLPEMPLRVSALRSLGAYVNVFAIESFMDELAKSARLDPVDFRLRHLQDERARAVIHAAAADFGWSHRVADGDDCGCGFAFARYKNLAAYCAIAMQVRVEPESGRIRIERVSAAVDTGEVINPDGVRNQIEGAILQSLSWTLFERVTFDDTRITSVDWGGYPILRFSSVPEHVSVRVLERPGEPFLGCGEAAQGPAAAALANALAAATGQRWRDLPLDPARIKGSLHYESAP